MVTEYVPLHQNLYFVIYRIRQSITILAYKTIINETIMNSEGLLRQSVFNCVFNFFLRFMAIRSKQKRDNDILTLIRVTGV